MQVLRDIRDYSTMAIDHFEEHIEPRFIARAALLQSGGGGESSSSMLRFLSATASKRGGGGGGETALLSSALFDTVGVDGSVVAAALDASGGNELESLRTEVRDQRRLIEEQARHIARISNVLNEVRVCAASMQKWQF